MRIAIALAVAVSLSCGAGAGEPAPVRIDLVDIHAHIGTFQGYDLSLPTLLAAMAKGSVGMALVSNIDGADLPGATANLDEDRANQRTAEAVKHNPGRLRGILWARPVDGTPAHLERLLRDATTAPLFVGVKLHPEFNHFAADAPLVDGYLALCERYHLVAVFHSGRAGSLSSPERIYAAARRHPSVPVVLYHMGFGTSHADAIAVVAQARAHHDAQLYLETAQVEPDAVIAAIRAVGSDRVLFGTDATYFGADHYAEYRALLTRLRRDLSDEDFARVTHGNARRLFRLD